MSTQLSSTTGIFVWTAGRNAPALGASKRRKREVGGCYDVVPADRIFRSRLYDRVSSGSAGFLLKVDVSRRLGNSNCSGV
jgi:hypothetical protein